MCADFLTSFFVTSLLIQLSKTFLQQSFIKGIFSLLLHVYNVQLFMWKIQYCKPDCVINIMNIGEKQ